MYLLPWSVSTSGYVFVDRDGKHFRHVLNWLRDGVVPTLKDAEYSELLREAEYYQLLGLIDGINAVLDKRKDNEELDTELTRTDIIKCIQFEKVKFRGVNLSGLDLSKLVIFLTRFWFLWIFLLARFWFLKELVMLPSATLHIRACMNIVPSSDYATDSLDQLLVLLWQLSN
ncbi:hypothetical protein CsSME_00046275 [Camellia sinensis var. sinensis]